MDLTCKKCGKRNSKVVPAKKLAELLNNEDSKVVNPDTKASLNSTAASVGMIDPRILIQIIPQILKLAEMVFDWLKKKDKNERNVIVCLDCGHWEKI